MRRPPHAILQAGVLLVALLIAPRAVLAASPDAFEPDQNTAAAKAIADGETQNRSITPASNYDWAKFTLATHASVLVRTQAGAGPGGDTEIWVHGPNGLVGTNDNFSGQYSQVSAQNLPAGTYYILIREHGNNAEIDSYQLFVDVTAATTTADAFESDNTAATAKVIADGETQNRSIHAVGDVDYVKFTVAATSELILRTAGPSGDALMRLYGPNVSTKLLESSNGAGGHGFSEITRNVAERNALTPGTYFIKIEEYGNNGTIGAYTVFIDLISGNALDAFEPDDTVNAAKTIADAETQNRTIHAPGNLDFAKFTLTTASEVTLRTAGASGDTVMYLYGPNSTTKVVETNDDGPSGKFSEIVRNQAGNDSLAAGTYYVKVEEFGNNAAIAAYTLFFDATALPPPPNEPNDTAATAFAITAGPALNDSIHVAGNLDFFKFNLATTSVLWDVTIETNGAAGDTVMSLYGPGASQPFIETDDDDGPGNFSRIERNTEPTALGPGDYIVKVQELGNNEPIGAYTITLTAVSRLATPPSTGIVFSEKGDLYGYDDFTVPANPSKSVERTKMDTIRAISVPLNAYPNLTFQSGTPANATISPTAPTSGDQTINNTGVLKGSSKVTARAGAVEQGFYNVSVYNKVSKTVAITLVHDLDTDGAGANLGFTTPDISDASITAALKKTYKQAVIEWTLVRRPAVTVNFDLNNDGKIDVNSWMSAEMAVVRDAAKSDHQYNVFLVANPSDGTTGFMDFNQKFGFIHPPDALANTVAHELGHGQGLQHTPADVLNIMYNFKSAAKFRLRKSQWDSLNP